MKGFGEDQCELVIRIIEPTSTLCLVSLNNNVFVLVGLPISSFEYSKEMLNVLQSITDKSIEIFDNINEIDLNLFKEKKIIVLTTNKIYSEMNKDGIESFILLGQNENKEIEYLKDLIFELSDELYRFYQREMNDHLRLNEFNLANQKKEISNEIYFQLNKLYRLKEDLFLSKNLIVRKETTLIWFKSDSDENGQLFQLLNNQLTNVISSFQFFDNYDQFYSHLLTEENVSNVFVIIDNECVVDLNGLKFVKEIYRFSSNLSNEEKLLKIIHRLIDHFNNLSNEFKDKKDLILSKEMLNKTIQLCQILIEILNK